ncbi:MAG: NADH-quinone oxidoreductase subunit M [Actinobacteria bacterium]|jgi:NADH-quinone oxidoreductase subunit M|nr:NADH-quinone oxidoreductase subunit M [Actinomycetota bacterium]NBQ59619.1 NADH-quinone oxidoreductase subunit M [Actinomycetota bacterium]NBY83015.1 NADH-quinone oxidoreductase subunit M [Actinomycetota bacterium]NCA25379.1 NADH-quinone oxidoreductase subunit M [Actinomycetota bacterium]NCU96228.1 NADH-quinone oxidoreductase subunit M [Actinomycetota bacterium]
MSLLTAIGLLPLISAGMIALIPTRNNELIKRATLVATTIIAISSIFLAVSFDKNSDQLQFVQKNSWISAFNINFSLGIDGISLVLILLSTILVPIVILATWNESENGRWSSKVFYVLLLTLESLMIGVFAANDLFLFYVFFEAMLIPVYFLIGGYGTGNKSAAAIKFLLYSLFGGLLMLASIIGVYIISSNQIGATFDITQLATLEIDNQTENFLFLGFFIAFAIKAPLWPFHTWLPDAAKAATPGTSVLLLGVLDKVGTYGMIRFCIQLFPDASKTFTPLIITLAVISIIYGAFMAIGQRDIKGLIAFTSISHFGFITMGIFAMTTQGMSGANLYMINHGFSTAALFLIAGWMISRRGSSTISDFGGLQRVTPVMAWSFFIAGMSSLALPGLSSFISEFLVLVGTYTRYPVAAIIGTLGIVLAALYILIPVQKALHGPIVSGNENLKDLNLREKIAIAPVILVIVFMGFYPKPVLDLINPTSEKVVVNAGFSDPIAKVGK